VKTNRKNISPVCCLVCGLALLCSCAPTVATQRVPVSTAPMGAQVLADGKAACVTPCEVELARNRDHILVLTKDGYLQQDVVLRRQYQTEKALVGAINSGMRQASFMKDAGYGVRGGMDTLQRQEETGEAYLLLPGTVSVRLVPKAGVPAAATPEQAGQALAAGLCPLDLMDAGDESALEHVLETSRSGLSSVWENRASGAVFAVVPESAETDQGAIVRWFSLAASRAGEKIAGRYPAFRVGNGEWEVGLPRTAGPDAPAAQPVGAGTAMRVLGQTRVPVYQKDWKLGSSGSSSTSTSVSGPPGDRTVTTTTKTSSSSVKAGVSVSPQSVLQALDALGVAGKE
jgi:hypothetical protein